MSYSSKNKHDYEDFELFIARQRKMMVKYLFLGILIAIVFAVFIAVFLTVL